MKFFLIIIYLQMFFNFLSFFLLNVFLTFPSFVSEFHLTFSWKLLEIMPALLTLFFLTLIRKHPGVTLRGGSTESQPLPHASKILFFLHILCSAEFRAL